MTESIKFSHAIWPFCIIGKEEVKEIRFTVSENTLPKFEVKIAEAPDFVLANGTSNVDGDVI